MHTAELYHLYMEANRPGGSRTLFMAIVPEEKNDSFGTDRVNLPRNRWRGWTKVSVTRSQTRKKLLSEGSPHQERRRPILATH
jgi:hypothetical protein